MFSDIGLMSLIRPDITVLMRALYWA